MATYKVIQDVEAEDKILGPLSLRQMIYIVIALFAGFLAYTLGKTSIVLAIPFIPIILFFGALGAPFGIEQSTEVWLLAKIRFFIKPRTRIWNQDGIKELVTITAPKRINKRYTDGLSQTEVRSRLSALATTLDSRGWAVKNAGLANNAATQESDRLFNPEQAPAETAKYDLPASEDIMDETANTTAQQMDALMKKTAEARKQQLVEKMKNPQTQEQQNYWFMHEQQAKQTKPGQDAFTNQNVVAPGTKQENTASESPEEKALASKIKSTKKSDAYYGHMKKLKPMAEQEAERQKALKAQAEADKAKAASKPAANPDILRLANNDDLNISTIAHELNKDSDDGEVVVSLH